MHAIDVAVTQIGIQEETGNNDGIPAQRYMRGNKLAWCAGFVLYCFEVSDDPNIHESVRDFWRYTAVWEFEERMKARGLWFGWAIVPQPNDLIFFNNRGKSDHANSKLDRHMAIVEKVDGAWVHTIEGNLGNAVKRSKHKLSSNRITGYARVCAI